MAHCSQGMWGLEGDNGFGATNLMSKSVGREMPFIKPVALYTLALGQLS